MKTLTVSLITLLVFTSCHSTKKWREFNSKKIAIAENTESYNFIKFDNKKNLYLGGLFYKETEDHKAFCLLYKSKDYGRKWSKLEVDSRPGEIQDIAFNKTSIVVVQKPLFYDRGSILLSKDGGKSWTSVYSYQNEYIIESISIDSSNTIYFITTSENRIKKLTKISATKVDTINFPADIKHLFFSKKEFIGITNSLKKSELIKYDLNANEISRKKLDLDKVYRDSKQNYNGDIVLYNMASLDNRFQIIRNDTNTLFDLRKFEDFIIFEPFIEDSLIIINSTYDPEHYFLGSPHIFLVSEDFGKTWKEEKIPSPSITRPATLKSKRFIAKAGRLSFQERR